MKKIFLGSDHGGYGLKQKIIEFLQSKNYEVEDVGCYSDESCDYPPFGKAVGKKVVENKGALGIVTCGAGVGISIAANKVKGVRCVLANSVEQTKLGREHNDTNVLSMGGRTHFDDDPLDIVDTFISTQTDTSNRHMRRRGMLDEL